MGNSLSGGGARHSWQLGWMGLSDNRTTVGLVSIPTSALRQVVIVFAAASATRTTVLERAACTVAHFFSLAVLPLPFWPPLQKPSQYPRSRAYAPTELPSTYFGQRKAWWSWWRIAAEDATEAALLPISPKLLNVLAHVATFFRERSGHRRWRSFIRCPSYWGEETPSVDDLFSEWSST
jgi:hypothetical protein